MGAVTPGGGVVGRGMRLEVLEPGTRRSGVVALLPGGQWVVPLGGYEMGGFFIGSLGVGGVFAVLGLLGGAAVADRAAPRSSAERVTDRYFMISSSLDLGIQHVSDSCRSNPCAVPHFRFPCPKVRIFA